jgi:hypothetical protein
LPTDKFCQSTGVREASTHPIKRCASENQQKRNITLSRRRTFSGSNADKIGTLFDLVFEEEELSGASLGAISAV